jgi:hypothetical protein
VDERGWDGRGDGTNEGMGWTRPSTKGQAVRDMNHTKTLGLTKNTRIYNDNTQHAGIDR